MEFLNPWGLLALLALPAVLALHFLRRRDNHFRHHWIRPGTGNIVFIGNEMSKRVLECFLHQKGGSADNRIHDKEARKC